MRISSNYPVCLCGIPQTVNLKLNRNLLKPSSSKLSKLAGYAEKSEAKGWVAVYTASNAGIAAFTAQAPGADEFALAGVEVLMATHILNGIYNFNLSKTAIKSLATGVAGPVIGKTTFKLASKSLTWIPIIGNTLNATVAAATTAALGAALISTAEEMDEARRRGKKLQDFLDEMEKR